MSEARMTVSRFIGGFYNPSRRPSALDYLRPIEYETRYDDQTKLTLPANRPPKRDNSNSSLQPR